MKKITKIINATAWLLNMVLSAILVSRPCDFDQNLGLAIFTTYMSSIGLSITFPNIFKKESSQDEVQMKNITGVFVLFFLITFLISSN